MDGITCPSCGEFIDQFCHPDKDCGGRVDRQRRLRYGVSMTTTKTKQITLAEVRKELKRIAADNPDAVNPTGFSGHGSPTCLYHKGRGRNISRCIIGQMGYNMGLPTPAAEAGGVDDVAEYGGVWTGMFTPKAVEYMVDVQAMADGVDAPIPWGQVKL